MSSQDSDAELPLFQQKKYIRKQKELKDQIEQEQSSTVKSETKTIPAARSEESKEASKTSGARKVYEGTAPKILSKEKALKMGILNSKNPNADFNNPNNPNYKGRLTNKIIDTYLPKTKTGKQQINIFKEKEEEPIDTLYEAQRERERERGGNERVTK